MNSEVEVFITTCNREEGLHRLLQSLIPCKSEFSSVTIIDNGNCDIDKLKKYENSFKITYMRNESDIGFFGSLDVALEHVSKEFFVVYHDDDLAIPGALMKQVNFLENNPHVALVGTDIYVFNEFGENFEYSRGYHESLKIFDRRELLRAYLEKGFFLPFPTIMYRKIVMNSNSVSFLGIFSGPCTDALMTIKLNCEYEIAFINQRLYNYYRPTLRTVFDDSATGQFYVHHYELLVGLVTHTRPRRDELKMIKKEARETTRKNIVKMILIADSNQQAAFVKIILERKEFRELCIYLKWIHIFRSNLDRVISVLRFARNVKQGYKKLMTLLAVAVIALVRLPIPCADHVL